MTKSVFVAMPFRKQYDGLFDIILHAATLCSFSVRRIDKESFTGSIITHIVNAIEETDLVIAVLSEENGNVYYEVGLAHAQKKPVIILTSDPSTLKFDLQDHRAIVYDLQHPEETVEILVSTISSITTMPSNPTAYLDKYFQPASEQSLERAKNTVISEAKLQKPVKVTSLTFLEDSKEVALELTDFMENRVRAIVDINGIIRVFKQF